MKANLRSIQKQRVYSIEFKKQIVSEFESGKYSVPQLERLHGIGNATIYSWIYKFSTFNEKGSRIVEMKQSSSKKVKDLEKRIKELEAAVGRKQIKIDFLETMMEVAKDELDIDIKKNFSTPQSEDSKENSK
jgi:transposase-like protein